MPAIRPIQALCFDTPPGSDVSRYIAPPYDVLDEPAKRPLLEVCDHNIVKIDLPHLPPKTVGPDATYEAAGRELDRWRNSGIVRPLSQPAIFGYRQTFSHADGAPIKRLGLFVNVAVSPFGPGQDGIGGLFPHEQTFPAPKEDRFKLMRATSTQLSPIFGIYNDPQLEINSLLSKSIDEPPFWRGTTAHDDVLHEIWRVEDPQAIDQVTSAIARMDIFIADGHHRYDTALHYQEWQREQPGQLPPEHPSNFCMFVLVAMDDPGMTILPTHRVLGPLVNFSLGRFASKAGSHLKITPFDAGSAPSHDALAALANRLPDHGPHAIGLFCASDEQMPMAIATTLDPDPLASEFPNQSQVWRQLDVTIVQQLFVERICKAHFCGEAGEIQWKFTHRLEQLPDQTARGEWPLALILQPTPLESVRQISQASELMPQKSTFFYPKVATGFVMHPLE